MLQTNLKNYTLLPEDKEIAMHICHELIPETYNAQSIINNLVQVALKNDESHLKEKAKRESKKFRKRPKEKLKKLRYCLKIYLTNLIFLSFEYGLDASLRVSRSKQQAIDHRYIPDEFNMNSQREAQDILMLPENALIRGNLGAYDPSGHNGIQTIIKPSERLLSAIKTLKESDFSHTVPKECIILKSKQKKDTDYSEKPKGKWASYEDTSYSNKARSQLTAINQFLREADIKLFGKDLPQRHRQLRRYFNESFGQGGRMFGGAWQGSKEMRKNYTINGERCVEVDFQACGLRLAYAKAGLSFDEKHSRDPYNYISYPRSGVKKMVSAMLCSSSPIKKFPKGMREALGVGKHVKVGDITKTIELNFPEISHLFYTGIGLELMYTESEILINALLKLQSQGIIALPIHDCLMVAESDQETAKEKMLQSFTEISGKKGSISVTKL